jgi:hypothetical protein
MALSGCAGSARAGDDGKEDEAEPLAVAGLD